MLWLAGNAGAHTANETGNTFHSDHADDRGDDSERDGDSGPCDTLCNVDRVAAATGRRHPGGNIARRCAVAWHCLAGNPRGGPDFRSKERQARGRASWLKRIVPGNRPRTRTGWSNCTASRRKPKRAEDQNAANASTKPENFPPANGLNCFWMKARSKNSTNLCGTGAWILARRSSVRRATASSPDSDASKGGWYTSLRRTSPCSADRSRRPMRR